MNDDDVAAARNTIEQHMIDRLRDRLPGHTRPQRLGLLRHAFDELRHRCFMLGSVEVDEFGKPKPPTRGEEAFNDVSDVLFEELAAILKTYPR